MKIYPKKYEDLYKTEQNLVTNLGVAETHFDSLEEYVALYKEENKRLNQMVWDIYVRQLWLEFQFVYKGQHRTKGIANNPFFDRGFSQFQKFVVGYSRLVILGRNYSFISSYIKYYYPAFLEMNPFENPELFKFPFEEIGLPHMALVSEIHNRVEMLEYAEKNGMSFAEFANWAINQVFCFNDEQGAEIYSITMGGNHTPILVDNTVKDVRKRFGPTRKAVDFSMDIPHSGGNASREPISQGEAAIPFKTEIVLQRSEKDSRRGTSNGTSMRKRSCVIPTKQIS